MKTETQTIRRRNWLILLLILVVTFIPFLGETLFNTKGEPREAIVAMSMLQSGDWILPVSYGSDIPYKPPFLAWCIAAFSALFGGHVTEFTSRLPSALACIAMVMAGFSLYTRESHGHGSGAVAVVAAFITFTSFEVHRAAYACRVDMLLTAFIVCAIYTLYWYYRFGRLRELVLLAVFLMSCGVLTKGPVGMILPCLVIGVFRLTEGEHFWKVLMSMAAIGLASLLLPALWYVAAYHSGGQEFLDLAMEENFGRFLGKMSYSSHANPVWYNFVTLFAGFLPYTLLLLLTLFSLRCGNSSTVPTSFSAWIKQQWRRFLAMRPISRLSLLAAVLIFSFYCFPESKRSVYLLPVYPFIAYFIALYLRRMVVAVPRMVKVYCAFIAFLAMAAPLLFAIVRFGALDGVGSGSLRRSIDGLMSVDAGVVGMLMLALSFGAGLSLVVSLFREPARNCLAWSVGTTVLIYWSFSAVYQPGVLNTKSDLPVARDIERLYPSTAPIYSLVDDSMLRYYTINFYLDDRLRRFDAELPAEGYLLVGRNDAEKLISPYQGRYCFELLRGFDHKSCDVHQPINLYRFTLKNKAVVEDRSTTALERGE